jgi:putative ABC transport system permease protein
MIGLFDDLRQAARTLWRTPAFSLTAALTLALGVGATTTLVSAMDAMLFRPPVSVEAPTRIVRTYFRSTNPQWGDWTNSSTSFPDYLDLSQAASFEGVAAQYGTSASMGRGAEARSVDLMAVTGNYFGLLGAKAMLGRLILPEDDRPEAGTRALVLSERMWRTRFASDPAILGRSLPIDRWVYTVVGVAPRGFDGGNHQPADGWIALNPVGAEAVGEKFRTSRGWYWVQIIARLAPSATRQHAAAEATSLIRMGRDSSSMNGFREVLLGPVQEARGPDYSESARLVYWLAGVSLIVLLISCANVANLQLVRGLARSRELAIRKALGGGRGRIARQLFLEGVWLAVLAGGAGILVCQWGGDLLRRFVLPAGMTDNFRIDLRVCAIAAAASALAALLSSLLPALSVVRGELTPVLKDGARGTGFRHSRLRSSLVVAQVALSILLVVGAALFVQSLRNVRAIDIGYDRGNIIMVSADPVSAGFSGQATGEAFTTMAEAARAYPGVESAAVTYGEPFGWSLARDLKIAGMDSLPRLSSGGPYVQSVSGDYFRTMGLSIQAGRAFSDADRRPYPAVALVGATMARRYFPVGKALGQCLMLQKQQTCTEVIGVVKDGIRYSPQEEPQAIYYVPLPPPDSSTRHLTLFVRTRTDASAMAAGLRTALQTAVPNLPYVQARSMEEVLAPQYRAWRLGATLFGLFATLALVLASLGIYSVLAYAVRGRTRELGIRLALGALPVSLLALVVRDGLRLTLIGVGLGTVGALVAGRALGSLIYGVSSRDAGTLLLAGTTVILVALLASLLPARRAARVDPMQSLRSD